MIKFEKIAKELVGGDRWMTCDSSAACSIGILKAGNFAYNISIDACWAYANGLPFLSVCNDRWTAENAVRELFKLMFEDNFIETPVKKD